MRDIILSLIVFGSLPFILVRPYYGILMWSWLSYMNPHRFTYGFAHTFPFAQTVAIALLAGIFFSRDPKRFPVTPITVVWIIFVLWMVLTTTTAIYPDLAMMQLEKVIKIQLIIFLTLLLIQTRDQIDKLIWVIILSIGYFGFKGGAFTILTGGGHRVYGPAGSFIAENNALALSILMIIPLMRYLQLHSQNKWIRYGLLAGMGLCAISVLGSQSRGALLAIIAVAIFFWIKSSKKLLIGLLIVISSVIFYTYMPDSWHARMETIADYENDASAMQRLNSWAYCINLANDKIMGGGFNSWSKETFLQYAPDPEHVFVAHSIYLGVAADHGWIGLFLFITILLMAWRNATKIIKEAGSKGLTWAVDFAKMAQVSLVAYCSGGTFLSLSYFDLPWHIISIIVLVRICVKGEQVSDSESEIKSNIRSSSVITN